MNDSGLSEEYERMANSLIEDFVSSLSTTNREMLQKKARILLCSALNGGLLPYVSQGINHNLHLKGMDWLKSVPYHGNGELCKAMEEANRVYIIDLDYFVERYTRRTNPQLELGKF